MSSIRNSGQFAVLIAAAALYTATLIVGTARFYQHLHLLLLAMQYCLILPLLLWSLPKRQPHESTEAGRVPRITVALLCVAFALLAFPLSRFSVQGLLNPDESGYSFQARIYRSGRIMADPLIGATADVRRTPAELFYANHISSQRGWFPKFPPGWPLMLSLGYLISARWLLNPLFGLLQLAAIAAIAKRVFVVETGALAVFFGILSPFYLVNSIGMMSHAFCAFLSTAACLALFAALATKNLWCYAAMFACLAAMLQVRPYTGFIMVMVLTLSALWLNRASRKTAIQILGIGAVFGSIALFGVLVYNHAYTGKWFVSPYAMAAGSDVPPELSFNPARIWQGIRNYAPQTTEESLMGAFPFAYLLAVYALLREKARRKEVWILALIWLALVLAYLAHPDGSGDFFGERFHFEGYFAILLLAARGAQLLIERRGLPRSSVVWVVILLGAIQVAQQAATAIAVARRGEPYRKVREAIAASDFSGLVLLHDAPGFVAKHINLNEADWRHASRVYLVDAESDDRSEWTCRYGFSRWMVVSYDVHSRQTVTEEGNANCAANLH